MQPTGDAADGVLQVVGPGFEGIPSILDPGSVNWLRYDVL